MNPYNQNAPPGGADPNWQSWRQPPPSSYAIAPPNLHAFNPSATASSVSLVSSLGVENGASTMNSTNFHPAPQFNYQPPAPGYAHPPQNPYFLAQHQQQQQQPWNHAAFGMSPASSNSSTFTLPLGAGPPRPNNDPSHSQRTMSWHSYNNSGQPGSTPSVSPTTTSHSTFMDIPSSRGRNGSNATVQSAPLPAPMSLAEQIMLDERKEKARLELLRLSNEEQQRLIQLQINPPEEYMTTTFPEPSPVGGSGQQQPQPEPKASFNPPENVTELPNKYNFKPARAPHSPRELPHTPNPGSGSMFSDVDEMVNRLGGLGINQRPQPTAHELLNTNNIVQANFHELPPTNTVHYTLQELPVTNSRYAPSVPPNIFELSHSPSVVKKPLPSHAELPSSLRVKSNSFSMGPSAAPRVPAKKPLPYPSTSTMPYGTKYLIPEIKHPPPTVAELDSTAPQPWKAELEAPFGGGGMPPTARSADDVRARQAREEEERRRLQREVEAWSLEQQQQQGAGTWPMYR